MNSEHSADVSQQLGSAPVGRLLLKLAAPAVAAQLVNLLYNIVDRIYIGHMPQAGTAALTGVGLCFPVIYLISAFTMLIAQGGAPRAAIAMGQGDNRRAETIMGSCFTCLVAAALALTALFWAVGEPLLWLFGCSEETILYALPYMRIYSSGSIFVMMALGMNLFITTQGFTRFSMKTVLIGAVCNIILDPIFIYGLRMGVRGAALATVISQALSAAWVTGFLLSDRSSLKIRKKCLRLERGILVSIFSLGISPFIMRATESFISIVLNHGLQAYGGDLHVGALTIMQSVMQLFAAPIGGFTQGMTPIISYNYGAGNFGRVKQLYRWMIGLCFGFMVITTATTMLFPEFYARFFTNETVLVELVGKVMPVFMAGMLVFGLQNGIQPTFLALGQAKVSLFIAVLRKIILLIPLAVILPRFFGVMGVYYAEPVSDIISATTASVLFLLNIRKILSAESLAKIR